MQISSNFLEKVVQSDLKHAIKANTNALAKELNCVRIGIVQEDFDNTNSTVKVKIASRQVLRYNHDGTQTSQDYPTIFAKVCYCNPYETFPLKQGDEVVLLFNDRELETWFINGQANSQHHQRMHDLTDCIAIAGIRSLPKMIEAMTNCLHLFYGGSDIQVHDEDITANTPSLVVNAEDSISLNGTSAISLSTTTISVDSTSNSFNGATTIDNTLTANSVIALDGATGAFTSIDGKTITVTNGIITGIS